MSEPVKRTGRQRKRPDPVMEKINNYFAHSGLTLQQLGVRMGMAEPARIAAEQFLKRTSDPRLSMVRRFADALEIWIGDLFV